MKKFPLQKNGDILSECQDMQVWFYPEFSRHFGRYYRKGVVVMPTRSEIENTIKALLVRYNAEYALLFGSYARGEETPDSDIDVVVFGGKNFKKSNIFAFAEDLREALGINADVFEISEVDKGSPLYENLMNEGIEILR